MCIVSNWVNEAQDLIAVKKYDDLPNSLIPNDDDDNVPTSTSPTTASHRLLKYQMLMQHLHRLGDAKVITVHLSWPQITLLPSKM